MSALTTATHAVAARAATVPADGYNPFSGISPSFGPFNGVLSSKIGIMLSLAWAIAFCWAAYQLIESGGRLASAKKSKNPVALQEAQGDIVMPVAGTIFLAILPLIYAILIK